MLTSVTRNCLLACLFVLSGLMARANDSDVVNCNRAWKIAVLGSSTAYGTGASAYDSSWVSRFTAYVKRKNSLSQVYNLGIPGFTTYQNLCPTGFVPPANRPAPNDAFNITAALLLKPDAIIINMPSNDAVNDYTVEEQQANFERAVYLADSARIPVWVTTTQPRNNISAAQVNNLTAMRDWINTRFGVKSVDFWTTVSNADGSINALFNFDNTHVNNAGHALFYNRVKAETILDSLCNRVAQVAVARAGDDMSFVLPVSNVQLNGTGSYSSNGGFLTSYQWSLVTGPNSPLIDEPQSAVTEIDNLVEGRYTFVLTVQDNQFNTSTDTVNILVSSRILIDFGPDATSSPDDNDIYWNNIADGRPGIKLSNAVTTGNLPTTIGLTVINRIDGTFNINGPGTNTGNTAGDVEDYPETSTTDYAFAEPSATNGQWKITGLQSTKEYRIKFWGTRSVSDDRIIQIRIANQNNWQEYNAASNTDYDRAAVFTVYGKTEVTFDIRVKNGSPFGYISLIDISRTEPAARVNVAPRAIVNDVAVSLPSTSATLDGSASVDDDGTITNYSWTQISGPTQAGIVSPNAAVTNINNLALGVYVFQFSITDDSSAVTTTNVTVTVSNRILFDFGAISTNSPDAGGKYWNNVSDGLPGVKISNAVNIGNNPTSITLEILNRLDGTFNLSGPGVNTSSINTAVGDYPASAVSDFTFAHNSTTTGQWKLSGLDSLQQYSVKFWGTRDATDDRIILVRILGDSVWKQFDARFNTDFNNAAILTFAARKEVIFEFQVGSTSTFGHISIVDINITDAPDCAPALSISSNYNTPVCPGTTITFTSTAEHPGTQPTYVWKRNNVAIPGATEATLSISDLNDNDVITCTMTANTGCPFGVIAESNPITVSVIAPVVLGSINGPTDACPLIGNSATYRVDAVNGVSVYNWTAPAGTTIINGQGTNEITLSYNAGFGTSGNLLVTGGTCSNPVPSILTIVKNTPEAPGDIAGPATVCGSVGNNTQITYSVAPVAYASSYLWSLPSNTTVISGQGTAAITVAFQNGFTSGTLSVKAVSNCFTSTSSSLNIFGSTIQTPGAISGATDACPFAGTNAQVTYKINKVPAAAGYIWTVPSNVTIVSRPGTGVNDTLIKVTFGIAYASGGQISVQATGCGTSLKSNLTILKKVPEAPAAISIVNYPCRANTHSNPIGTFRITKIAGLQYQWTAPAGSYISISSNATTETATITFPSSFNSGNISVSAINSCGRSSARIQAINVLNPRNVSLNLTGPSNPCTFMGTTNKATYFVNKVPGASSYNWSVPSQGTIVNHPASGENDTLITVQFTNAFKKGKISVSANSPCGSSPVKSIDLKKKSPDRTSNISLRSTTNCPNRRHVYSVSSIPAGASSVYWTVPYGATILSGQGTTTITVAYPNNWIVGFVTAYGKNNCGYSFPSKYFIALGNCNSYSGKGQDQIVNKVEPTTSGLDVTVMPNPSTSEFKVIANSNDNQMRCMLRIMDINGKLMETRTGISIGQAVTLGSRYAPGMYIGEFIQGNNKKIIKLVKQ